MGPRLRARLVSSQTHAWGPIAELQGTQNSCHPHATCVGNCYTLNLSSIVQEKVPATSVTGGATTPSGSVSREKETVKTAKHSDEIDRTVGGPCQSCAAGSVSIEWNCPDCGNTGWDPLAEPSDGTERKLKGSWEG